jgi:hypothetical protein
MTGAVTVAVILGLCLFRGDNYDVVLARMMGLLPGALAPGDGPPKGRPCRRPGEGWSESRCGRCSSGPQEWATQGQCGGTKSDQELEHRIDTCRVVMMIMAARGRTG